MTTATPSPGTTPGLPVRRKTPHSEQNPYHRALYLHSMIKAAAHILESLESVPEIQKCGLGDFVDVIEKRANALALDLDEGVFCEGWEPLKSALASNPSLGLTY